jgi:hypothetical protein
MADQIQINVVVTADASPLDAVKSGLTGLAAPLAALGEASAQTGQAQQQMMQKMLHDALQAS